jgi:hypothetical protein
VEVAITIAWLTRLFPTLGAYPALVTTVVVLRVVATVFQSASAWTLLQRLPTALLLTRWTFLAVAALVTLEVGLRLAPSSVFPGHRWPLVGAYWAVAIVVLIWTMRSSGQASRAPAPVRAERERERLR